MQRTTVPVRVIVVLLLPGFARNINDVYQVNYIYRDIVVIFSCKNIMIYISINIETVFRNVFRLLSYFLTLRQVDKCNNDENRTEVENKLNKYFYNPEIPGRGSIPGYRDWKIVRDPEIWDPGIAVPTSHERC